MEVFLGIAASDGIGIGPAFVIPESVKRAVPQNKILAKDTDFHWKRFENAKKIVSAEIQINLAKLPKEKSTEIQREILETYILMLDDPVFLQEVKDEFEKSLNNIELTLETKAEEYAARLRNAGNEYLAERAQDITDIFGRVLDEMLGIHPFDINQVPDGCIIIAPALSPTDTIILSKRKLSGLILSQGGISSHVVILARNYGIPTIIGVEESCVCKKIKNGGIVIVDTASSEVIIEPDADILKDYADKIVKLSKEEESLNTYRNKPAVTKDGVEFKIFANIGTPEEAETALAEGAAGIGLFRTEFLYMSKMEGSFNLAGRSFDENSQFECYKKVLELMDNKPVTIRTLDAGGDKLINSVDIPNFDEKNPLMGMRAIRLCLRYPQLLKTQLRALYRASVYGNLYIMLPLITTTEQVKSCLSLAEKVKDELRSENIPFNENVPIGIMIETAAAAITSDCLAKVCGFFSIGTNDLTQYTLGIDRENSQVSDLYDEFNLAILRLINTTVQNAIKANIPVAVCGEMAGKKDSVLVLGGLGIRNLSMSPKLISRTKKILSQFTIQELQSISDEKLNQL